VRLGKPVGGEVNLELICRNLAQGFVNKRFRLTASRIAGDGDLLMRHNGVVLAGIL